MWIILILITLFIVRRILVGMAKSSDAYLEFIVNGINPELHKLIKNQPIKLKYFQSLNSLQQWKKFSSLNYLKKRFEEDKYLHERIKNEIPILKKNITDYQNSYDRILSEFHLKKPKLKWYVSFQIEKDIKKSQQIFSNSNYYNMFDIVWGYTSPQGRNSYESRSKFTHYQVSQVLSQLEENKVSKGSVKYEESQMTQSLSKDNISRTNASSFNNHNNNSIIDVTGNSHIIKQKKSLDKYAQDIPEWKNQYVYCFTDIKQASEAQRKFYHSFKANFLRGNYIDLYRNTNYAFILMNDFKIEYEIDKNLAKLETQLKILGECYPETITNGKLIVKLKKEEVNTYSSKIINISSNNNYFDDYWKLGNKYKDKLNLNEEEAKLLNAIYNPNNAFFNIEYCSLEILKLYMALISALKDKYIHEKTTIDEQFLAVADIIARKEFRYRNGSENYKYCIQSRTNDFYTNILKYCENEIREFYGHKRKLNTDNYYTNLEAIKELERRITSKVNQILPTLISKISPPDTNTEIELNTINTSRWRIKFEELIANYNDKPQEFVDSIIALSKLNKKNPSVENIFFEASKFIAKYNKESSLCLYIHYLYHDLKSATFDNKQHTKTIQKSLFKTNEELHDFEKIVSELIKDKNLEKALKQIPEIYKVKRKKIQFNNATIKDTIEQHSVTVDLLNEYLRDDFEDENNTIKSKEISSEEIQIEITQKNEEGHQSSFISELTFTAIHTTTLELFAKSNFSVPQNELEVFAKSKGVFKNQLIESINDTCYEFLDDLLIEEEDDYYTINTDYFQRILIKNDRQN